MITKYQTSVYSLLLGISKQCLNQQEAVIGRTSSEERRKVSEINGVVDCSLKHRVSSGAQMLFYLPFQG